MRLDKIALITGAANGIGRELCRKFCHEGYTVWAVDISEPALQTLQAELAKFGEALIPYKADVSNEQQMRALLTTLKDQRVALTYWINNAGVPGTGALDSLSHTEFLRVLQVNLGGVILGSRLALEWMNELGSGTIVNVGSVAGHLPAPLMSAYVASKHGVVGFTRALRAELRLKTSPIRCVLVSPGFVETQMIQKGEKLGFPEWLSFLLSTPEKVVAEIWQGLQRQQAEIFPTFNGRLMLRMQRFFPELTVRGSRLLLTRSWKDIFLNRFDAC